MTSTAPTRLLDRIHDKWRDHILTGLAVLMVLHLFVFAPIETEQTPLRPVGVLFVAGLAAGLLILARSFVPIAGLIAFYNEVVDTFLDGAQLPRPKTHFV